LDGHGGEASASPRSSGPLNTSGLNLRSHRGLEVEKDRLAETLKEMKSLGHRSQADGEMPLRSKL